MRSASLRASLRRKEKGAFFCSPSTYKGAGACTCSFDVLGYFQPSPAGIGFSIACICHLGSWDTELFAFMNNSG
jgi:hypothetical protein